MENKKNLIFWTVIVVAGASLILYSYFSRLVRYPLPSTSPDITQNISPTPVPTSTIGLLPTEELFLGLHGIKAPATCQVDGEVIFSGNDTFSSKNTKIAWQNVDSQGRLINWHINPKDNLAIGPNIFGSLTVPNGEYPNLTVRLPEKPISKTYLLTASITYGQIIGGDVKVKEVNCTGQVRINLNF